jgi:uroporphyrinogen-III synthase
LALHAAGRFAGARSPLLYLAGEDRAGDLAGELAARGQSSRIAVIYRAVRAVQFAAAARAALEQGRIDGVLHYSLRSAESYLDCSKLLMKDALFPVHYCLSERIAAPLRLAGAARVRVAARPDEASLIGLLGSGRVSV